MPKKQEQSAKRVKIAEEFEPQPLEELVADYHRRLEKYGGKHASKPHIDVDSRIKALTEGLADPDRANQHENYKAALKMYKAGKSPNSTGWYFVKGKLYPTLPDGKNKPKGAPVHVEKIYYQYRNMEPIRHTQMATSSQYRIEGTMHWIPFYMKGAGDHGGSENILYGTMCNDTGSNVLTLYPFEILAMGLPDHYTGWGDVVDIQTANGIIQRRKITIQVRLMSSDWLMTPLSDWMNEEAIVTLTDDDMRFNRLSGGMMRNKLFFATAPGSDMLFISNNKAGIMRDMPARPNASTGQF